MENTQIIPHLFRTEYRKITSVLIRHFGIEHIELAEDIASDTFMAATGLWGMRGLPENPTAWLYTVAKNKAKDHFKHQNIFSQSIVPAIQTNAQTSYEIEIDLSEKTITDSQLQMMFAICNPIISSENQIGLSLKILCGFGIEEIANALISPAETIKKRLQRANEKLRDAKVKIEIPNKEEIRDRLQTVLTTLYLLFNEAYYSASQNSVLRKDLCLEAMRLAYLLTEYKETRVHEVNALLALMCFQSSRFEARLNENGNTILYEEQDEKLWNAELILQGEYFFRLASENGQFSKYYYEAGIAYCHTQKEDSKEKWNRILQLYNQLLMLEHSPMVSLNRTYALSKAHSVDAATREAEKLPLTNHHLYHSLLGHFYAKKDTHKAKEHFETAIKLAKSESDKEITKNKIIALDK